jgi:transposase
VYCEDVPTANLLQQHHRAKAIADAGWRGFLSILAFKAANAGKRAVAVPPASTSQACSGGGVSVQQGFSVRWHACPECGTSRHRDHHAARNILALGKGKGKGKGKAEQKEDVGGGIALRREPSGMPQALPENPWGCEPRRRVREMSLDRSHRRPA